MTKIELAEACIAEYGADTQRLQMVEEMAELTVELCHLGRGRFNQDKVAEEVADTLAMLDQMDVMFDVDKNWNCKGWGNDDRESLISSMGYIQMYLAGYVVKSDEKKILQALFPVLRIRLISLRETIGVEKVEAWQKKKHDRMVERLTR